ncbi:hypothetical protein HGRIS_006696 [Hohenbuehelia grisea]|uniref:DUF6533 domain-containing protein n=1 Tax=Hohenbuehelia grisea TaxID=104357 RepID=A0ABR3JAB7_9AGAR
MTQLSKCAEDVQLSSSILFGSEALFFYDYVLTLGDEIEFVWIAGKLSIGLILYLAARYLGLASCIISFLPVTPESSNAVTCASHYSREPAISQAPCSGVRVIAIIACEAIVAVRTWAIWSRDRWILVLLVALSIGAIVPAAITVTKDVSTKSSTQLRLISVLDGCQTATSTVGNGWVVPFAMVMMYEVVFGAVNTALVIQASAPQLRSSVTQYVFMSSPSKQFSLY